jgi:hypothetical protein
MKTLSLFLMILLSSPIVHSQTIVISDIDDTIKLSNIRANKLSVVFRGLFVSDAFSGMNTLYNEFEKNQIDIYYVSGSPKIIGSRVSRFLEKHQFPQSENLILRDNLKVNTKKYKLKNIKKIIEDQNPVSVILIGDDTEYDPEIFYEIYQAFPDKVKGIYIRLVANDQVMPDVKSENPKMIQTFFSPIEIAFWENKNQRMSLGSIINVSNSFRKLKDDEGYHLPRRYCPENGMPSIDEMINQLRKDQTVDLAVENLILLDALQSTQKVIQAHCK